MKHRLDQLMQQRGLVRSRSQAESWIRLGKVRVNGRTARKAGEFVDENALIELQADEQYVSRAGLKLASVAKALALRFKDKVMLDVGSSTGGFTDYALQHGARKVIAVDVGTDQLHPSLHGDPRIELHEQTDIRNLFLTGGFSGATVAGDRSRAVKEPRSLRSPRTLSGSASVESPATVVPECPPVEISEMPDIVVIDVSFISLRDILPHVAKLSKPETQIVAMVKPQFEARGSNLKHKGVIKNDRMRREILKDYETWSRQYFTILGKADSEVAGAKGNLERFYLLRKL